MNQRLAEALQDRYVIDREIGRGGMATVYLARDVRHHRPVALKVLNPELGAVLGVGRFLAEIEVTANLQHPNLLPLFDSGEVEGLLFYVMPYVEGESLRHRLERERQLPVDEAVRIAVAIAQALDYAHRHKVIHRDLKPENILLHEGQPLVADFGIALAVSNAGGARITQTGLSLGTPQYMSPEQATGDRSVDGRSDIYALGAITYEMLVGDPPHVASTAQAVIAKVMTERPSPVRSSRPTVPLHVDATIRRALEKLPADRFGTAREFAEGLEGRGTTLASLRDDAAYGPGAAGTARRWQIATGILALLLVITAGLALRAAKSPGPAATATHVIRANFDLPPGARIADALGGTTIAVSPAGDLIAFTATTPAGPRMYIRHVDELTARELEVPNAGRNLTFSPDGSWLAFSEGTALRKVAVDGGKAVEIGGTAGSVPYGLAWSASDTIFIGTYSGLHSIPAAGGEAVAVARIDSTGTRVGQRWPLLLPNGRSILYAAGNSSAAAAQLAVVDRASGRITSYPLQVSVPLGILADQLVFVSAAGELMAVRIDTGTGRPLGDPVRLDEGLLFDPTGGAKASLSASGTLAFLRGRAQFQPVLVSAATGVAEPMVEELRTYATPRFSPDGRRVAIGITTGATTDIWIYDLARNTLSRLTTEGVNIRPEWTPDGKHLVYISDRQGQPAIWRQPVDGGGPAELLYRPEVEPFEAIVSPDLRWLVFRSAPGLKYPRDILAVPYARTGPVTPLVTGPASQNMPRLSPDGKWLAYQSSEAGRFEIYVRPFPGNAGSVQVSTEGGTEPLWGRDGRSLYYRGPVGEPIRVAVSTGDAFAIGARTVMASGEYLTDASHPSWDVAPDGRLLMLRRTGAGAQVVVVHNWIRELQEKTTERR